MIRLKPGVSLDNVHPRIFHLIAVAGPIWAKYGSTDLWITGANEPGHGVGSRGYHRLVDGTCQAVDVRTWTISDPISRRQAVDDLAAEVGSLYDVLFEEQRNDPLTGAVLRGEHAHCQYDPARPGTVA